MKYSPKPYERSLTRYILRQDGTIGKIIDAALAKAVVEVERFGVPKDAGKDFFFADYPGLSRRVDGILRSMSARITDTITTGIEWAWDLSNTKNDSLVWSVINSIGSARVPYYAPATWMQKNLPALEAFEERRVGGMNLSDRVWKYSTSMKGDLELALDLGLGEGMSADRLSREVRMYLREPDRLYRRVRDEKGVLRLSKSASNYHPGPGVYRSSYKNAKRLAATETNMAYRSADFARYQELDFVLGIEIHLSNNHTCLGPDGKPHPFHDICDELAGRYPATFKFTGWHPLCRCYVTTILPTQDEMLAYLAGMREDGLSTYGFKGKVTSMPPQFKEWVADNADRIERAKERGTLPYFLRDNDWAWESELDEVKAASAGIDADIAKALGMKKGEPMSFADADTGRENPYFEKGVNNGYSHNCQTCTVTHELRRRGFDIEAKPNNNGEVWAYLKKEGANFYGRYMKENGEVVQWYRDWDKITKWKYENDFEKLSQARVLKFVEEKTAAVGRYEVVNNWKRGNSGHVWIAERQKDGSLLFFDPQSSESGLDMMKRYIKASKLDSFEVLRIDDKGVNPVMAKLFVKVGE